MDILLALAAIIAAVAFAALVIFLVVSVAPVLKETKRTLSHVADTLEGFDKQVNGIIVESQALLNKTNKLADEIQEKTTKLNTVVDGVKNVGATFTDLTESVRTVSKAVHQVAEENKETTAQAIKWSTVVLELFKNNKNK
ncbi:MULTISPECIES: DUF948 domain-containing protein [Gracilibacillus]|uniref:DUF948 domain-containing protein n=1 Tax=Gracilibacillus TaxID=74385 RepID=UPI000826D011|nr:MULTISPECIES: DUF948 domain-containing protein [Gracilibacillus]